MRQYKVAIVYKGVRYVDVMIHAKSQAQAEDRCFGYADSSKLNRLNYDPELVELYFLDEPRHQVLFDDVGLRSVHGLIKI